MTERGSKYGNFFTQAQISQSIKLAMKASKNWYSLSDDQKECLEMLAHKISRILNGDPNYEDSWLDIEGYAHLISARFQHEQ